MASRRSDTSQGAENKRLGSYDEDSEEEAPKDRMTITTDYERHRTRVALRTGSPKPTAKLTLRPVKSKTQQTPPSSVSRAASRASTSPSKASVGPKTSLRGKPTTSSPERKPWGAPTIRTPAYHEESVSKRKRPALDISASEETPTPKQKKKPTGRYSLAELLALRPPPTVRYAALRSYREESAPDLGYASHSSASSRRYSTVSHSDDSQFDMGYANPPPTFPTRRRQTLSYSTESEAAVGTRSQSVPPRYSATSIRNEVHNFAPEFREHSSIHSNGSRQDGAERRSFASSSRHSSTVSSEEHYPQSLSSDSRVSIASTQATSHSKDQKENQSTSVDDLESRIRSALSHRGRRNFGVPKHLRSVRWDPAIVTPTHGAMDGVVETIESSQPALVGEKVNPAETQSVEDNHKVERKKEKRQFYEYMKSMTELKRGDRNKLLRFLEALKNLDSDDSSDTDTEAQKVRRKSTHTTHPEAKSRLNPTANAFPVRSPTQLKATEETTSSALVIPQEYHYPNEPVWVKTNDFFHASRGDNVAHQNYTTEESSAHALPDTLPSQAPLVLPPSQFVPYTIASIPLPPRTKHNASSFPAKQALRRETTRVNPKLPIIDLATGRIPDDDGSGREAHVVPWGLLILERFQKKYPGTGIHRAAAPAPVLNTHAASIQQRLEYLLMEQKEKQARGEGLNERSGNTGQNLAKLGYQAEKDAMKRLKAEIRKEDLDRKLREHLLPTNNIKIRVLGPTAERVSEASTAIDSVHSGLETDVE